jgi:hypothetical protein
MNNSYRLQDHFFPKNQRVKNKKTKEQFIKISDLNIHNIEEFSKTLFNQEKEPMT